MKRLHPQKFVVVNADDLGLCPGTNKAIIEAHTKGVLTSASLLATCPGFLDAVRKIKRNKKLGIGIHLSLTLGKSVLPKKIVPDLVNEQRMFYPGYKRLLLSDHRKIREQIRLEFEAQIKKITDKGIRLDHIDSQEHVHMIPYIYEIVLSLAAKYKIPFVRLSKDKILITSNHMHNIHPFINKNLIKLFLLNTLAAKNIKMKHIQSKYPRAFFGVYHTGHMAASVFDAIIKDIKPGVAEILTHPGYAVNDTSFDFESQKMLSFMTNENRKKELEVLLDQNLKKVFKENDIILITFRKASKT